MRDASRFREMTERCECPRDSVHPIADKSPVRMTWTHAEHDDVSLDAMIPFLTGDWDCLRNRQERERISAVREAPEYERTSRGTSRA